MVIRLSSDLQALVETTAKEKGITPSEFVEYVLGLYLPKVEQTVSETLLTHTQRRNRRKAKQK